MLNLVSHRVMVFGTFDVFHPGHQYFISEALERGGEGAELVVVIARDKTVQRIKPLLRNPENERLRVVQEAFPQVMVVLGDEEDYLKVVREHRPALVCLGYDQEGFSAELAEAFPEICVQRIGPFQPEKYKSSKM